MPRAVSPEVAISLRRLGLRPRDLVLYVTSACNLRCRHCYVGTSLLNVAERYDARDLVDFAASFSELARVTVLGGEPLLHRRINEILEGLIGLKVPELRVTTNLTSLFHLDIARLPPASLVVAVSLDGHDAATHDAIRGRNSFHRTLSNIELLVRSGWTVEITHTVMAPNIDQLPAMIALCRQLGVHLLNLHLISMMGNALANPELIVPPERWVLARAMLESASIPDGELRIRYPPLFVTDAEYEKLCESGEYRPHAAGSYHVDGRGDRIVLYPNGEVYISSEAFGTDSFIGRIADGRFIRNPGSNNELELYSRDSRLSIAEVTAERVGSTAHPRVLSVSYKRTIFA